MNALEFPSDQELNAKEKNTRAIKWSELPLGVVYAIKATKVIEGKYGQSFIGDLESRGCERYKVWLPRRLGDEVKDIKLPVFVRSEGLMQSKKSSYKYYAYTLL